MEISPVTLTGQRVQLEPLAERHADALYLAGRAPEIWQYMPRGPFVSIEDVREWIAGAQRQAALGCQLPFAIVHLGMGRAVGSTRYLDIALPDRRLEIGWTWLARDVWRTPVNTECKYLLLKHAFETMGCIRVQLKTDLRNTRSQQAIERLGAVREGVLRKHMILTDHGDFQRSSVMYGITDDEWPAVGARLEAKMRGC